MLYFYANLNKFFCIMALSKIKKLKGFVMKKLTIMSVAAMALLFVGCGEKPKATEANATEMNVTTEANATEAAVVETNATEANATTVDANATEANATAE